MTAKLPNFIRADEAMRIAEGFFAKAGDVCEENAQAAQDTVDRMFLDHAAKASRKLAAALCDQRRGPASLAQRTFAQYSPTEPVPGDENLSQLREVGGDASHAHEALERSSECWVRIFEHFRGAADTSEERDLYEACGRLIDTWKRNLSIAFQQRKEM